jgi:ornithine cyclodeaminase/alanine dehydrogenase-like protein (mu-crystallin family)
VGNAAQDVVVAHLAYTHATTGGIGIVADL